MLDSPKGTSSSLRCCAHVSGTTWSSAPLDHSATAHSGASQASDHCEALQGNLFPGGAIVPAQWLTRGPSST